MVKIHDFLGGAIKGFGETFFPQLEQMRSQHIQNLQQQNEQSLLNQALTDAQKIYANPDLSPEEKQIGLYKALSRSPEVAKSLGEQLNKTQKQSQTQQLLSQIFGGDQEAQQESSQIPRQQTSPQTQQGFNPEALSDAQ